MPFVEFQSTPVIADGRTNFNAVVLVGALVFQSTPVIADGRTQAVEGVGVHLDVSIHTRHR